MNESSPPPSSTPAWRLSADVPVPLWCVDLGNTALKVQFAEPGTRGRRALSIPRRVVEEDPASAARQVASATPAGNTASLALVSLARASDEELIRGLLTVVAPNAAVHLLNASQPLPFRVNYTEGTPGPDRLANVMAVRHLAGRLPAVAIDFGTATNMVVVDEAGDFAGGVILPGLALQTDSLTERTKGRLPKVELERGGERPRALATSTLEAIRAGVLLGHAGAVERLLQEIERELGRPLQFVAATGGNCSFVLPLLARPVEHHLNLVLTGLRAWAAYMPERSSGL